VPRASDLPFYTVEPFSCQDALTHNPLGVKGCGEAGAIGLLRPVVKRSLDRHALGGKDVGHIDMPVTTAAGLGRR